MNTRLIGFGSIIVLLAACAPKGPTMAPSTQSFTRNVNAVPAKVVEAATAVFAERQIPVASADQTNGKVQSVPLAPNGEWGNVSADQRVDCGAVAAADSNARLVLTVHVKQENNRSALSLDAKRDGGQSCVLKGPFMTDLLDEIVAKAGAV
jgi:hypothetical protein